MPLEIVGLNRPEVTFVWEDEHRTTYLARTLRLRCRCAHCVEEMSGRPLLDPARVAADIVPRAIELVGQYAINIKWSDGHETGIYHFRRLREDCPCSECTQKRSQSPEKSQPKSPK